jgi:hypothetical protein
MKKILLLIIISITAFGQDIAQLRKEFIAANQSSKSSVAFLESTAKLSDKALHQAYKGAAMVIHAKFAKGVEEKKKWAKQGISLLEEAVKKDAKNIEIRTIRLSIQEQSPKVLKYKGKVEEDREFVSTEVTKLPNGPLKTFVEGYLNQK